MANYSLNETQTTALLDAIAIIKKAPVKEFNVTLKSVLEEIEALLITSTSEKAKKYLEKVSQTLNLMGLTEESGMILHVRQNVTLKNDELKDKYKEVDMDLKLIEGIKISVLEALIGAGFNSGLQVVKHDSKELSFLTRIPPEEIVIIQNDIKSFLDKF